MFQGVWLVITSIFAGFEDMQVEAQGGTWQDQMLALHNAQRSGRYPLKLNNKLMAAAQKHADWMGKTGTMSHTGANRSSMSDRIDAEKYTWSAIGENVAYGYPTEREVVRGWMRSFGHRMNILNKNFTEVGFGRCVDPRDGTVFWCADFGRPR